MSAPKMLNLKVRDPSSFGVRDAWMRALERTAPIARTASRTFPVVVQELADQFRNSIALFSAEETLTYKALAERSNKYARWALEAGVKRGETVCLLMPNRPDYLAIWLGITQVGGVVALINANLRGHSLAHCIAVANPKHVIVASELTNQLAHATPLLECQPAIWTHGVSEFDAPRIDLAISNIPGEKLNGAEAVPTTINDLALYIYTSGTTGLPKAAKVSHYRIMAWSHWFAGMMDAKPHDRMYNCLPLYHSAGGIVAACAPLVNGGSVYLREKFSASGFWDDAVSHDCTLFQYIGELCRYLLAAAKHPAETSHRIRLCCGNGLREEVWHRFKERFRIPAILEFYAATEANFSLYNVEGKPGAIGRIPSFLPRRSQVTLVKHDSETDEPVRSHDGLCIESAPNEPGEAIALISSNGSNLASSFEGYSTKEETEKKILRNVFAAGDAWYRTGDLMRKDSEGYFYFVDRAGDTFRWKGENTSTSEVADAIASFKGIRDVIVYGVSIPGVDGRAGMAALVIDEAFGLDGLLAHLGERLPSTAVPLFLRLKDKLDVTETFKPKKIDLVCQGFDPNKIEDQLYFNDRPSKSFVRLDPELYQRILLGHIVL